MGRFVTPEGQRIKEALDKSRKERETLYRRCDHVTGRLKEAGFPLMAKAVKSHVILGTGDDALLDEIEGLLENLDARPG